jgi:antitoxin (DNA-binding transcriptional repressor) of toxin-antitoxin stability system
MCRIRFHSGRRIKTLNSPAAVSIGCIRPNSCYNDHNDHNDHRSKIMAITVSAVDARHRLGELLNRVSLANEEIIIERAGKKIAKLVGIDVDTSRDQGKLDFRKAAGLGAELWQNMDADAYVKGEREQWD